MFQLPEQAAWFLSASLPGSAALYLYGQTGRFRLPPAGPVVLQLPEQAVWNQNVVPPALAPFSSPHRLMPRGTALPRFQHGRYFRQVPLKLQSRYFR